MSALNYLLRQFLSDVKQDATNDSHFHHEAHVIVDARSRTNNAKRNERTWPVVSGATSTDKIGATMRSAETPRGVIVPGLVGIGSPDHRSNIGIDAATKASVRRARTDL